MKKDGVLLINLGTPSKPTRDSVKKYLKEFLMDKRVILLPWLLRWCLVNLIIIPLRTKQSTHAYQSIWMQKGAPLRVFTEKMVDALQSRLSSNVQVVMAMRYGNPSIPEAVNQFKSDIKSLLIIPIFPQYTSAVNGSAIQKIMESLEKKLNIPNIKIISEFYYEPFYIQSMADIIKKQVGILKNQYFMFSYHGLPRDQNNITADKPNACLNCIDICEQSSSDTPICYKQRCYKTTQLIAEAMSLKKTQYSTSFQSRLGKKEWLKPYNEVALQDLYRMGIKKIIVVCPSFVVDCIETLEEIGIRLKAYWSSIGGEDLTLVSCLNDETIWMDRFSQFIEKHMG